MITNSSSSSAPTKSSWRFKLLSFLFVFGIIFVLYAITSGPDSSDSGSYNGPSLSQP